MVKEGSHQQGILKISRLDRGKKFIFPLAVIVAFLVGSGSFFAISVLREDIAKMPFDTTNVLKAPNLKDIIDFHTDVLFNLFNFNYIRVKLALMRQNTLLRAYNAETVTENLVWMTIFNLQTVTSYPTYGLVNFIRFTKLHFHWLILNIRFKFFWKVNPEATTGWARRDFIRGIWQYYKTGDTVFLIDRFTNDLTKITTARLYINHLVLGSFFDIQQNDFLKELAKKHTLLSGNLLSSNAFNGDKDVVVEGFKSIIKNVEEKHDRSDFFQRVTAAKRWQAIVALLSSIELVDQPIGFNASIKNMLNNKLLEKTFYSTIHALPETFFFSSLIYIPKNIIFIVTELVTDFFYFFSIIPSFFLSFIRRLLSLNIVTSGSNAFSTGAIFGQFVTNTSSIVQTLLYLTVFLSVVTFLEFCVSYQLRFFVYYTLINLGYFAVLRTLFNDPEYLTKKTATMARAYVRILNDVSNLLFSKKFFSALEVLFSSSNGFFLSFVNFMFLILKSVTSIVTFSFGALVTFIVRPFQTISICLGRMSEAYISLHLPATFNFAENITLPANFFNKRMKSTFTELEIFFNHCTSLSFFQKNKEWLAYKMAQLQFFESIYIATEKSLAFDFQRLLVKYFEYDVSISGSISLDKTYKIIDDFLLPIQKQLMKDSEEILKAIKTENIKIFFHTNLKEGIPPILVEGDLNYKKFLEIFGGDLEKAISSSTLFELEKNLLEDIYYTLHIRKSIYNIEIFPRITFGQLSNQIEIYFERSFPSRVLRWSSEGTAELFTQYLNHIIFVSTNPGAKKGRIIELLKSILRYIDDNFLLRKIKIVPISTEHIKKIIFSNLEKNIDLRKSLAVFQTKVVSHLEIPLSFYAGRINSGVLGILHSSILPGAQALNNRKKILTQVIFQNDFIGRYAIGGKIPRFTDTMLENIDAKIKSFKPHEPFPIIDKDNFMMKYILPQGTKESINSDLMRIQETINKNQFSTLWLSFNEYATKKNSWPIKTNVNFTMHDPISPFSLNNCLFNINSCRKFAVQELMKLKFFNTLSVVCFIVCLFFVFNYLFIES